MFTATEARLSQIINESVDNQQFVGDFDVYGIGSLEDIVARTGSMLSEAAIGVAVAGCASRPYFVEAGMSAMSGRPSDIEAFDAISEGIISSGIERVKSWLEIAKKAVKAIIEKIKLSLTAMIGKTDKWVATVKPMLDRKGAKDQSEFMYTAAPWEVKDLSKESIDFKEEDLNKHIFMLTTIANGIDKGGEFASTGSTSAELKAIHEADKIEDIMAKIFDGAENASELKKDMHEKYRGKKAAVDIKGFREIGPDAMMSMIEGVAKAEEALTKKYDLVDTELTKAMKAYAKAEAAVKGFSMDDALKTVDEKDRPSKRDEFNSKRSEMTAIIAKATTVTNTTLQMFNVKVATFRSLMNQQKSDYMKVLTKYAKAAAVK